MKLGFSDAEICIVKRGQGCREQGELCQRLGPEIAPLVLRLVDDGYEMEILEPLEARGVRPDLAVGRHMYARLERNVWTRPSGVDDRGWLAPLYGWAVESPWVDRMIHAIYGDREPDDGYSLIHGDPTFANLMMRGDEWIITDPMPRARHRPEIPCRSAVDVGKLLQSMTGWEALQGMRLAPQGEEHSLIDKLPQSPWTNECILWAAIHTARLNRRATKKQDARIAGWAHRKSLMFASILERRL